MTEQENTTIPVSYQFTPEELAQAKAELANLTPEQYLERSRYTKQLEESQQLGEAGGICFTRLYGGHGGELNITARAVTPTKAVIDLLEAVRYVMNWQKDMDWKPSRQSSQSNQSVSSAPVQEQAPVLVQTSPVQGGFVATTTGAQVQYVPDQLSGNTQTFPAEMLVATMTQGKVYWKVKGGQWTKYGVTVWPETLAAAGIDVNQLNPNAVNALPPGLTAHYTVKDDGRTPQKVVSITR